MKKPGIPGILPTARAAIALSFQPRCTNKYHPQRRGQVLSTYPLSNDPVVCNENSSGGGNVDYFTIIGDFQQRSLILTSKGRKNIDENQSLGQESPGLSNAD
jgi:hypothetical protein